MNITPFINDFWNDVISQNKKALEKYFCKDAEIFWHNTNELFIPEEYIIANCEYPGCWNKNVEKIEVFANKAVSVTRVWSDDNDFYAVSFFEFNGEKISVLSEYWGENGTAPIWRLEKNIGKPIK